MKKNITVACVVIALVAAFAFAVSTHTSNPYTYSSDGTEVSGTFADAKDDDSTNVHIYRDNPDSEKVTIMLVKVEEHNDERHAPKEKVIVDSVMPKAEAEQLLQQNGYPEF